MTSHALPAWESPDRPPRSSAQVRRAADLPSGTEFTASGAGLWEEGLWEEVPGFRALASRPPGLARARSRRVPLWPLGPSRMLV